MKTVKELEKLNWIDSEGAITNDGMYEVYEVIESLKNEGYERMTYSVESEDNAYNDDEFCGSLEECEKYAKKYYTLGKNAQIALITLDDDACVNYTHNILYDVSLLGNYEED